MSLAESRWQRTLTLCGLYVAQGIPWGFMLITLPSYLSYEKGIGDAEIGRLKGIILLPWSFKLIWAPLIDSVTIRSMGRRRPWILLAEVMMAVTLLGFVGLGDVSSSIRYLLLMYFLHNCFASLQDVATDALALDVLPFHEQGQANALMWASKLFGKGIAAAGLAVVLKYWGLTACVSLQIAALLGIMLIPLCLIERPGERRLPWGGSVTQEVEAPSVRNPMIVLREMLRGFSLTTTAMYVVFTLLSLLGSGLNEVVTNTLYTQHLTPRWTAVEFSTAAGFYATFPILAGSWMGGWFSDRYGRHPLLIAGLGVYAVSAFLFGLNPSLWNVRPVALTYVLLSETLAAIISVGFISLAMRISWTTAAATLFTTYMTLSNVSHMLGNWLAGPVRAAWKFGVESEGADLRSYQLTFLTVAALSLVPLMFLMWVRPSEVDRQKADDETRRLREISSAEPTAQAG